jgi:hypothetical protein
MEKGFDKIINQVKQHKDLPTLNSQLIIGNLQSGGLRKMLIFLQQFCLS